MKRDTTRTWKKKTLKKKAEFFSCRETSEFYGEKKISAFLGAPTNLENSETLIGKSDGNRDETGEFLLLPMLFT